MASKSTLEECPEGVASIYVRKGRRGMKGVRKVKGESFKRGPGARKDSDTYPEGGPGSLMEGPKGFTDILRRPGRDKTKKRT